MNLHKIYRHKKSISVFCFMTIMAIQTIRLILFCQRTRITKYWRNSCARCTTFFLQTEIYLYTFNFTQ